MKVLIALLLILAVAFSFRTHHKMESKLETQQVVGSYCSAYEPDAG